MSTPAGWYDDGSGRQRWWDGQLWTDHYADQQPAASATANGGVVANLTATQDPSEPEGTLWSAVGKPLTGLGAGRYRLTEEYLIFEKGTLSTKSQQIRVHEIFDVDGSQSMQQKARGVGTITLWARRPSGDERILLEDVPNFREGVTAINRAADEARHRAITRQNTQHVSYTGAPAAHAAPVAQPAAQQSSTGSAGLDLNAELGKLAAYREQGVLDDEEFAAAKRRLLGL